MPMIIIMPSFIMMNISRLLTRAADDADDHDEHHDHDQRSEHDRDARAMLLSTRRGEHFHVAPETTQNVFIEDKNG
jgi:hypothetical protein